MTAETISPNEKARLAALIRRSIRMKLVLLGSTLVVIWGIWSALEAGHQKVARLLEAFALQHPEMIEPLAIKKADISNPENLQRIESAIEVAKRLNSFLVEGMSKDPNSVPADTYLGKQLKDISDFEQKRKEAYIVEASLPYLKTTATVNTLFLADVWPFLILLTLSCLVAINYRQRTYEVLLASLVSRERDSGCPESLALAEFLVGDLAKCDHPRCNLWLYRKPLIILPEALLSTALAIAAVYLSLRLVALYNPTEVHPTFSILLSYYSLFWTTLVVLGLCLARTHSYFESYTEEQLGGRVRSARAHWALTWFHHGLAPNRFQKRGFRITARSSALLGPVVGLTSLLLPFVSPWGIKGYQLLLSQRPIASSSAQSTGPQIEMFRIDPSVYRELRVHIIVAILFLFICVASELAKLSRSHRHVGLIQTLRRYSGCAILFLVGNFILYLGVLQFESEINPSPAVLDSFFPAGLGFPHGMSLIFTDPDYGAWIFISTCVVFASISSLQRRARSM